MQLGGLQLECPVCSYDVFSRRRFGTLDPRSPAAQHTVISLPAIACDRCGAVQLFDPTARSQPDAPIPPRRVARLQRRPEAFDEEAADEGAEVVEETDDAGQDGWADESWAVDAEPSAGADLEGDHVIEDPPPSVDWEPDEGASTASDPGADGDAGPDLEPDTGTASEPAVEPEPLTAPDPAWVSDEPGAANQEPGAPDPPGQAPPEPPGPGAPPLDWPSPLPPLPPLPPLGHDDSPWPGDPSSR